MKPINDDNLKHLLPAAILMATGAHAGQIGKDGAPYILHPLRMMMEASSYAEMIVAVLHDVLEDTDLTTLDLVKVRMSPEIITAVDTLSRREGETYEKFIERIALNPLATRVKRLDLYDNIDVTRLPLLGEWELERIARYHLAIKRLEMEISA